MDVSLLEHRKNEEILEEARMEPIAVSREGEGWNGSGTFKEELKEKPSEQLWK